MLALIQFSPIQFSSRELDSSFGGLVTSTLLNLFVLPSLYLRLGRVEGNGSPLRSQPDSSLRSIDVAVFVLGTDGHSREEAGSSS
jgi:hypothetical protein